MEFQEGIGWGQLGIPAESRRPLLQESWPPGLRYLVRALCWVDESLLPSLSDLVWGWVAGFCGTSIIAPSRHICRLSLTLVYSAPDGAWAPRTSATFRMQPPEGASGCSAGPGVGGWGWSLQGMEEVARLDRMPPRGSLTEGHTWNWEVSVVRSRRLFFSPEVLQEVQRTRRAGQCGHEEQNGNGLTETDSDSRLNPAQSWVELETGWSGAFREASQVWSSLA